jgi:hypothetical protein
VALGRWSRADVAIAAAAVNIATIISATATGEAAVVFGFFVVVIVIILRRSAKEEISCY